MVLTITNLSLLVQTILDTPFAALWSTERSVLELSPFLKVDQNLNKKKLKARQELRRKVFTSFNGNAHLFETAAFRWVFKFSIIILWLLSLVWTVWYRMMWISGIEFSWCKLETGKFNGGFRIGFFSSVCFLLKFELKRHYVSGRAKPTYAHQQKAIAHVYSVYDRWSFERA